MTLLNPFKKFAALRAHACRVDTPTESLSRFFAFLTREAGPSAGRGARPRAWEPRFGSGCLESGLSIPLCAHYGQFFR